MRMIEPPIERGLGNWQQLPAPGSASTARAGRLSIHHHCTSSCSYGQSPGPLSSPVVSLLTTRQRQRLDRDRATRRWKEKLPGEPWPANVCHRNGNRTSGWRCDATSRVIGRRRTTYQQTTHARAKHTEHGCQKKLLCDSAPTGTKNSSGIIVAKQ